MPAAVIEAATPPSTIASTNALVMSVIQTSPVRGFQPSGTRVGLVLRPVEPRRVWVGPRSRRPPSARPS